MTLYITIGPPGAGKSTWADMNLASGILRLERDRFRECLMGSRRAYHESLFERGKLSAVVTQSMLSAMIYWPIPHWAVTDTGLDLPAVQPFIWHAERIGEPIELVIFPADAELLHNRNLERHHDHQVPVHILSERLEKYNDPEAWWRTVNYQKHHIGG